MFCPSCRSEYRVGFTECAQCRVLLVDELSTRASEQDGPPEFGESTSEPTDDFELISVFSSTNAMIIDIAESILRSADLEFMTRGRRIQGLFGWGGFPKGNSLAMGPMEIQCRREDAADAIILLEKLSAQSDTEALTHEAPDPDEERFYHGTRADLGPGDLIEVGRISNFGKRNTTTYVYLTATLDAAIWGAELAQGEGPGRIYVVEPTGLIVDDPNLTDKKFPGNPTKSYRSREPLRVTGEVTDWQGHSAETVQAMKDSIKGLEPIDD